MRYETQFQTQKNVSPYILFHKDIFEIKDHVSTFTLSPLKVRAVGI